MSTAEPSPRQQFLAFLHEDSDALSAEIFARFFAYRPAARAMFPANMVEHRAVFMDVLVYVVRSIDDPAAEPAMMAFLGQLGRDHRKFGATTEDYSAFRKSMAMVVSQRLGHRRTPEIDKLLLLLVRATTELMNAGAAQDPGPAFVEATVVEHIRATRDQAVIRLQADAPVPYRAGQYLSVRTTLGGWRYFSPTIPPNPGGQVEFLVRTVPGGDVSGQVVAGTRVGDRWRLGAAHGSMQVDRDAGCDVLMIAGGSGVAPMRSMIVDMARFGDNPRVHLFYGARHPGDLTEMPTLWRLSITNPWLTVVPVSEETEDPWWLTDTDSRYEPGMHSRQTGTLADVVTSYGAWSDRRVLVCGSPKMVEATVGRLLAAGTPRENIAFDPY
ncbi:FAD-binding oxidoreductase [Tomitella gaofuii]|uniref:FAD-binding oxidoreductase n=1 Tax=Tomitella gaofuii TaxID=2760083 RepID=UPI0015F9CF2C|nr:FAD-binding oxidoreductase [Tomitella gaofuii]